MIEVTDYFVGLVARNRMRFRWQMITVRRNGRLVAMLVGYIVCARDSAEQLAKATSEGEVNFVGENYLLSVFKNSFLEAWYKKNRGQKGSFRDTEFESSQMSYNNLLLSDESVPGIFFSIGMIAVHPEEQRQGHQKNARLFDR